VLCTSSAQMTNLRRLVEPADRFSGLPCRVTARTPAFSMRFRTTPTRGLVCDGWISGRGRCPRRGALVRNHRQAAVCRPFRSGCRRPAATSSTSRDGAVLVSTQSRRRLSR
jgi:hypothetical protein